MIELPAGWGEATLGELGRWCGGGTPSKERPAFWQNGDIPWVTPKDMKREQIDSAEDYITQAAVNGSATQVVGKGSVLVVTRSGILRHTLPVAVTACRAAINQDLKALSPAEGVAPLFLARQIQALSRLILSQCAKSGTTVDSVDFDRLKAFLVKIAPTAEQRRIVAKLDNLFTRTKAARDELDRIPLLIEHYKQAILGKAFSGELTADWRTQNSVAFPWSVVPVPELFEWGSGKSLRKKGLNSGEVPVYGGNGINGFHDAALTDMPTLVVGRVGAHCGNVHQTHGPAWITDNAIYAAAISEVVRLAYARMVFANVGLNSEAGGSGQPFVSQATLNAVHFPLPEPDEQDELVRRVETAMEWLNIVGLEQGKATQLLSHLDQGLMAKAFRGELVPQDPNDEPAERLLERIRQKCPDAPKAVRRRRAV